MRKLAMLGGTFNPIHNGHIQMALAFAEKLQLNRVLVVPTRIPPHKQVRDSTTAEDRLAMCRIAVEGNPVLEASDIELGREGPSYTVDTLRQLHEYYPEAKLYLITGADMFLTIQDWKNADEIFRLATICAAPREKNNFSVLQNHADRLKWKYLQAELLDIPLMPISSTEIRRRIQLGKSIEGLVPEGVARYIEQHHLYQG